MAKAISDGELLAVLEAGAMLSGNLAGPRRGQWDIAALDYALAYQRIKRTGSKRRLTMSIARRRLLGLARTISGATVTRKGGA